MSDIPEIDQGVSFRVTRQAVIRVEDWSPRPRRRNRGRGQAFTNINLDIPVFRPRDTTVMAELPADLATTLDAYQILRIQAFVQAQLLANHPVVPPVNPTPPLTNVNPRPIK